MTPIILLLTILDRGASPRTPNELAASCYPEDRLKLRGRFAKFAANTQHPPFTVEFGAKVEVFEALNLTRTTLAAHDIWVGSESWLDGGEHFEQLDACAEYLVRALQDVSAYAWSYERFQGNFSMYLLNHYIVTQAYKDVESGRKLVELLISHPDPYTGNFSNEAELQAALQQKMAAVGHKSLLAGI